MNKILSRSILLAALSTLSLTAGITPAHSDLTQKLRDHLDYKLEQDREILGDLAPPGAKIVRGEIVYPKDYLDSASKHVKTLEKDLRPFVRVFAMPTDDDPWSIVTAPLFAPLMTLLGIGHLESSPLPSDVAAQLKSYSDLKGVTFTSAEVISARWIKSDEGSGSILNSKNFGLDSITWDTLIVAGPGLRSATGCERMSLWAHEVAHLHQYARQGMNTFLVAYLTEGSQKKYDNMEQEIEAKNVEKIVFDACKNGSKPPDQAPRRSDENWFHKVNINEDNCEAITYSEGGTEIKWKQDGNLIHADKPLRSQDKGVLLCHYKFPSFATKVAVVGYGRMDWWSKHKNGELHHTGKGGGRGLIVFGGGATLDHTNVYDYRFYRRKEKERSPTKEVINEWKQPVLFREPVDRISIAIFFNGSWKDTKDTLRVANMFIQVPKNLQIFFH